MYEDIFAEYGAPLLVVCLCGTGFVLSAVVNAILERRLRHRIERTDDRGFGNGLLDALSSSHP
jgi:hypothetical protein